MNLFSSKEETVQNIGNNTLIFEMVQVTIIMRYVQNYKTISN